MSSAGTGSYEPPDRDVTAVEPSVVMRSERPAGEAERRMTRELGGDLPPVGGPRATTTSPGLPKPNWVPAC